MALVSPELAGLEQPSQSALDEPVEALRGSGKLRGFVYGKGEDVGFDPSRRRLDDVDLHERGGMVSEA